MKNLKYIVGALLAVFLLSSGTVVSHAAYLAPNGQEYQYCYEMHGLTGSMKDWTWKTFSNYPLVVVHNINSGDNPGGAHQLYYYDPIAQTVSLFNSISYDSLWSVRYKPDGSIYDQLHTAWGPYHYSGYPYYDNERNITVSHNYHECQTLAEAEKYLKNVLEGPSFSDATYDPEIGYLQDLEKNFRLLQLHSPGANTAADVNNRVFHFGWSSVTSTGFNLLNNEFQDIRIQVCVTPEAVFRNLFGKVRSLPLGQQKYYDFPSTFSADLLSLDFSVTDLQDNVLSEWFEYVKESQGFLESMNWKFKTYLRILAYDGSDWYYGGWSQIFFNQYVNIAIDSDTEFGVTVSGGQLLHQGSHDNPDYDPWVPETDSLSQSFVVGVGSSKEDALNDSYNKYLNSDSLSLSSDNFLQVLISLTQDVGQVPNLLKELFSYLPEYVFSSLGVVIVALCILRLMGR